MLFYAINVFFIQHILFHASEKCHISDIRLGDTRWMLDISLKLDLPVGDECEYQGHQRQTSSEDNNETQHTILVKGTGDSRGNTISYSATGMWEAVDCASIQRLHFVVTPASAIKQIQL